MPSPLVPLYLSLALTILGRASGASAEPFVARHSPTAGLSSAHASNRGRAHGPSDEVNHRDDRTVHHGRDRALYRG
jgi:hypothetical protein